MDLNQFNAEFVRRVQELDYPEVKVLRKEIFNIYRDLYKEWGALQIVLDKLEPELTNEQVISR